MVLQGLVVGDWVSVYKVVTITRIRLLVAPHHTPVSDDARQLGDRGADQCSNSGASAARPLSALPPFPLAW